MRIRLLTILLPTFVALIIGYVLADWYIAFPPDAPRQYVGRNTCAQCHQKESSLFENSHHDLAMDEASETTVSGDFNDIKIEHHGVTSRFWRDGKKFMVTTEGPDGKMGDFEISYVFGVEPLQQYMVELPQAEQPRDGAIGRMQVLRLSWNTITGNWFHLDPPDVCNHVEADDPLHWTGTMQNWNSSCAACHSTRLAKNHNPQTNSYQTTFSEIDVSCEACHGPAGLHLQIVSRGGLFPDRNHGTGLVDLKSTGNQTQVATCAPCHSRRGELTGDWSAGQNYHDHFACQIVETPVYFPDGQVRDEDYVFGSYIQSRMYDRGVKCSDCHDPHSLKLKFEGNTLCCNCHLSQHPAAKYDTPAHHHHTVGGPGSFCVDCHMPKTIYMEVDARRDHSIRSPRPDASVRLGTPNACSGCHVDKSKLPPESAAEIDQYIDWFRLKESGDVAVASELERIDREMAEAFADWYREPPVNPPRNDRYVRMAEAIVSADTGKTLIDTNRLARDLTYPGMMRASIIYNADFPEGRIDEVLETAIADSDPMVVTAAIRRLEQQLAELFQKPSLSARARATSRLIAGTLQHPTRVVRVTAARVLKNIPRERQIEFIGSENMEAYRQAIRELVENLRHNSDRAVSLMELADLAMSENDVETAMQHLRTAIAVEPKASGPRTNLGALIDSQVAGIRQTLMATGNDAVLTRRMDQLTAEASRLRREEHFLLERELKRSEGFEGVANLHYRYAMSCYLQGDVIGLEKHLKLAIDLEPENQNALLALATLYLERSEPELSSPHVRKLMDLEPDDPVHLQLNEMLKKQLEQKSSKNR